VAKIVVVEDEAELADAIAARLRSDGHSVIVAEDGPAAVRTVATAQPDVVVLDLMLPGFDGLEVCRRIQRDRPVPVIMLTARGSETDLVVGLEVGADDYLSKPFSMRELTARVRALLRRADRSASDPGQILRAGRVEVDVPRRRARLDGEVIALTVTEFDLLAFHGRVDRRRLPHARRVVPGPWHARAPVPGRGADLRARPRGSLECRESRVDRGRDERAQGRARAAA